MHAFLAVAEDIDVARDLDVDGVRIEQLSNQADTSAVEAYAAQVKQAKNLVRKLEADKQAVYDDGTHLWNSTQAAFADLTTYPKGLGLSLSRRWESHRQRMHAITLALKNAILDTLDGFTTLLEIAQQQQEAVNKKGIRGSIGLRDGQMSVSKRRHLSAPAGFGPKGRSLISPADSEQMESHLNLALGGVDEEEEDEDEDDDDEDDEMVDVGFALAKGKARPSNMQPTSTVVLQAQPAPPRDSGHKGGHWLALDPLSSGSQSSYGDAASSSHAGSTLAESEKDGDGTSTIRQSTDGTLAEEEDEDDLDLDRKSVCLLES